MKNEYPSAPMLADLKETLNITQNNRRLVKAWEILLRAAGNPDFSVVMDFALENELALPLDPDRTTLVDGQEVANATWINPNDGSELVCIPGGSCLVTKEDTRVVVPGFSLARYPVTNEQFSKFLAATRYEPPKEHAENEKFLQHWTKGKPPKGKADHPVVFVSQIDALAYCRWAGLMLPTEWLWEKAARGNDGRPFPWGDSTPLSSAAKLANIRSDGTTPVSRYPRTRTPYGCEDMIGNVSEWCRRTPKDDPTALPEPWPQYDLATEEPWLEIVRGACFLRLHSDRMKAHHRRQLSVIRRNFWVGFRPAMLLPCRPAF